MMSTPERPHSRFRDVYAVVSIDFPVDADSPENLISVIRVFTAKKDTERDTARLNALNADKGGRYHTCVTRMHAVQ